MVSVYDVNAEKLIMAVAKDLEGKVKAPDYTLYVKTGISREKAPTQKNWWHIRLAAVLRKFYSKNNLGVELLRGYFGSKQDRGVKRPHFKKGSGKIIRDCVQALDKLGYLEKTQKGRILTQKGRTYLDSVVNKISKGKK